MEFKQLEAFVNVIKYRSFSKAADATFLTQPTVSTHIRTLESEFGVKLIDRCGRVSVPTQAGKQFYEDALDILHKREQAMAKMTDQNSEMIGVLRIRTSSMPAQQFVPLAITEFHKKYPKVKFNMNMSDSESVIEDISETRGEIGFAGEVNTSALDKTLIDSDEMVLITPKNEKYQKLNERSEYLTMADIADEKFIWRESGSATRKVLENELMKHKTSKPSTIAIVEGVDTARKLVESGLGVSIVASSVTNSCEGCRDYYVFRFSDINFTRKYYMIHSRKVALSPVAMCFKQFILDNYL